MFQDIRTQIVPDQIGIPHSLGKQPLHAVGISFSGVLSQLPAIFAFDGTEQSLQIQKCPTTWFRSGKTGSDSCMQLGECLCPSHHLGNGRPRFKRNDMLLMLHCLLLSNEISESDIRTYRVSQMKEKIMKLFMVSQRVY